MWYAEEGSRRKDPLSMWTTFEMNRYNHAFSSSKYRTELEFAPFFHACIDDSKTKIIRDSLERWLRVRIHGWLKLGEDACLAGINTFNATTFMKFATYTSLAIFAYYGCCGKEMQFKKPPEFWMRRAIEVAKPSEGDVVDTCNDWLACHTDQQRLKNHLLNALTRKEKNFKMDNDSDDSSSSSDSDSES